MLPVSVKGCETPLSGENGKRIGRFLNRIAILDETVKIFADS